MSILGTRTSLPNFWSRLAFRTLILLGNLGRGALLVWGMLAIYWSNLPWGGLRVILAGVFGVVGVLGLVRMPRRRGWLLFGLLLTLVVIWQASIQPSNARDWRPEVAVLPGVSMDGDRVKLTGVRHFDYRTKSDFTVRYEEREVQLSHLQAVDFFISYWEADGDVGHTFVSFVFDNAPPVCISIEARLEKGETYSVIATCFKQAELIYVVGDERDIVRVRTNYRDEDVYLYRTRATPEQARALFLSYLKSINRLAGHPEFYSPLSNNCTVNIDRHAHNQGRGGPFDIRLLLNGHVDGLMYERHLLDTSVPFDQMRARSSITAKARKADGDIHFSQRIREGLAAPGF
ncbi:MAG: DUF4105 domain-containing protein [Prosthecobacter sp.]|nr:DUF4105 domain-containing protein [Prosthecobacter sp.]